MAERGAGPGKGAMEGSRFCAACGKEIESGVEVCLFCGERVPDRPEAACQPVESASAVQSRGASSSACTADSPAVGTGEWLVTLLLLGIPLVNVVLLLAWAFGDSTTPSKRNFSRAVLIIILIAFVVWLASFAAGIAILGGNPDLEQRVIEILGELLPG